MTQYLDPAYWSWASGGPNGGTLLEEGAEAILAYLVQRLEGGGCEVVEAHAIVHDKDERQVWSDVSKQIVIEPKPEHIHAVIKFAGRAKSAPIARLGDLLGVEPQYVEKPGRGRYAYDNMLSYLTHAKYADKYQYAPSEVATVRGPEYLGVDAARREAWLKGRAHVKKKRVAEDFEDMRERVLQGEITRHQIMLTDELFDIYSRHSREIDDALSAYGQRRAYRAAAKLRAGDFATQVVFIHGDAGVGKTRFAQDFITTAIASAKAHGQRWQLYRAATANPLDDWHGEEVMLLDDLRACAMDANDWLLLLDPYNASPAKARYKNKGEVAPRLIVVTATIEPVEFFFYARQKGNVDEALDQFIRRLASVVKVFREDDILRYRVQRIGKIEPYEWHKCELESYHHTQGVVGNLYHRQIAPRYELTYGPESSSDHCADGAVTELMVGLAEFNDDMQLLEATPEQLSAYHDELMADMEEAS
ncbi:Rep family protein [Solicola gregarius]|uniref:Rep family protein n=1 Tax=Solicola gregarius TaxID=2908642 RepID=A0AA46YKS1_9ACTN|nr:Rep family protein [Solicola gregarius]UYM06075.1 Rep family protein [Solicola gregarius]